jgi:hypothetical protein
MRYDEYLAQGWPMGTGVIEGACGHLMQDRLEQSGMRWTKAGAQAVLDLRAVRLNGHGDRDGRFIGNSHINGSITALRQCQRRRKASC